MAEAPLMVSISGMRGIVGQSMTPERVARYAAAFGHWLCQSRPCEEGPLVVLGRDSRPSGEMYELAAASGLAATGCRVVRLGVATTPGVAIMVEHAGADGGMVITASHNPIIWNGVKPLRHDGVAPPPEDVKDIIARFESGDITFAPVESLRPTRSRDETSRVHTEAILPHIDVELIRKANLHALVDSVHGAGGAEARELLDHLNVKLTHRHAEPTGLFPHPPEPTRQNLAGMCDATRAAGVDVAFAQDPDADRLAVVDERGEYIGEEYTLALAAKHVLKEGDRAVANLSTSRMLDDIADAAGAQVFRTPVGEANVADGMRKHSAVIGGEGNGGVIWSKVIHVRDSLVGMALVLEMLASRRKKLSEIVSEIPRYAIVKDKVPFDAALAASLDERMHDAFKGQKIDTQDGVRVDWPAPAARWVHVRPSNTEPILRIIAEASDAKAAEALVTEVRVALGIASETA